MRHPPDEDVCDGCGKPRRLRMRVSVGNAFNTPEGVVLEEPDRREAWYVCWCSPNPVMQEQPDGSWAWRRPTAEHSP